MLKGKRLLAMTLLLIATLIVGILETKDVQSLDGSCNYDLSGPSNISAGGETDNTTFKVVLFSNSNRTSSETFVRLQKSDGRTTFFTNQTLRIINVSGGETATFQAQYSPALSDDIYRVSAAVFYLNNTFYNYTATQFNCPNRTFTIETTEGGIAPAISEQVAVTVQKQKTNTTLIIAIVVIVALIYWISRKEK